MLQLKVATYRFAIPRSSNATERIEARAPIPAHCARTPPTPSTGAGDGAWRGTEEMQATRAPTINGVEPRAAAVLLLLPLLRAVKQRS